MKKIIFLSLFTCLISLPFTSNAQRESLNTIGASLGIIPTWHNGIYIGEPLYDWYDRKTTPVYNLFYLRKVSSSFSIGGYFEYESSTFEDRFEVSRLNLGAEWIGHFPDNSLNMQLGGYFGTGLISPSNYTSLMGIDYGFIAGPAFEKDNLGISLQVHAGFGYYWSKKDIETTLLYIPKIFLKVYYTF